MGRVIRVPELGIAIANVTIVEWLVKEGERVSRGQPLLEVMTDKMVMEVPAEVEGVLLRVLFGEEAQLTIGAPIAIIGETNEPMEPLLAEIEAEIQGVPGAMAVDKDGRPTTVPGTAPEAPARTTKILASPLAKRLAREKGIDLALVSPSGKGGRITREDVLSFEEGGEEQAQKRIALEETDEAYDVIPLKGTRRAIADNMVRSLQTAAHYTMGCDVDCTELVALRDRLKDAFKDQYGVDLTYVPFMVKAIAAAVRDVPIVNATIRDNRILVYKTAHVGVAVASDDFIFVPVIKQPISKTLLQVAQELTEFVRLVREQKLTPERTRGGTITLTNMGVTNATIKAGITIINQPEVAIVTQGRIKEQVVPVSGEMRIRPMMDITFTYDHRVVMGVPGGKFAERIQHYLESPELLLAC